MRHRFVSMLALALSWAAVAAAQRDFSSVEIATTRIADGLYMLEGAGGNIAVSAGADGVFLVDDQYAPLTDKITAAVRAISDRRIRFVINTHWHGDHTGGNENLGAAGAVVVAHDNVRERMSSEQFSRLWDRATPPSPAGALPVVTFADEVTFHLNGETIRAFHIAPAHTDGDTMVHFVTADVLHMGDVFFNGIYPYIDTGAGGSLAGMIAAVETALELVGPDTVVIPGHGPLADHAALVAYRDMLRGVEAAVAPLVDSGSSLDEIAAANPLEPYNEEWGDGFLDPESFLKTVVWGMGGD